MEYCTVKKLDRRGGAIKGHGKNYRAAFVIATGGMGGVGAVENYLTLRYLGASLRIFRDDNSAVDVDQLPGGVSVRRG